MFTNVLVGVDDENHGRDAIALAARLLEPGGELTVAHVYPGDTRLWRSQLPPQEAARDTLARELLDAARREAGIQAHARWCESYSVGRGLRELTERIGANLLVVGSSRRSLLGRVFIGDDTRDSLNGAACPVAMAPAGYAGEPHLLREIGVGYDGSLESEHALRVARTLASEHAARLSAFEAVSIPAIAFAGPVPDLEWVESVVDKAYERVAALEGVEPHAVYGRPAEELALFSASVDLLVVGSRGYGPVGRFVHGSVSQQLARSSRCPLLVLTRSSRAPERDERQPRAATDAAARAS